MGSHHEPHFNAEPGAVDIYQAFKRSLPRRAVIWNATMKTKLVPEPAG
jgi:hypothetical protein